MSQSQPLRIEHPSLGSFGTVRTQNSRLWFVNNRELEERSLGYLAKYQEKYGFILYAKVFQGNHYHLIGKFPRCNRAQFYRDYNARLAEGVRRHVPEFIGGTLLERRYSEQALPRDEDVEEEFFYAALQPVRAGLCERIGDHQGYNSFDDAVSGRVRKYKVVDWTAYHLAKRAGKRVRPRDFETVYRLKYARLPGYEHLSQKAYKKLMYEELEKRRLQLVKEYREKGHRFLTKDELRRVKPGSLPRTTKKSSRESYRPLVLTKCKETKKRFLAWYFAIYNQYKEAVAKYLAGDATAVFPPGTYKPPGPMAAVPI